MVVSTSGETVVLPWVSSVMLSPNFNEQKYFTIKRPEGCRTGFTTFQESFGTVFFVHDNLRHRHAAVNLQGRAGDEG
jgi:hypothetical protein